MIFDLGNISYIGRTLYDADFGIGQNDRRRHLHILGQTGTGKSTTLLHLISQDLAMGRNPPPRTVLRG
jgi:type IV secretory pathway VirB4 component